MLDLRPVIDQTADFQLMNIESELFDDLIGAVLSEGQFRDLIVELTRGGRQVSVVKVIANEIVDECERSGHIPWSERRARE